MSICLCTLALNEMQWLDKLYQQHRAWDGLRKWVYVESADRVYAETNPGMVTSDGLSVDGTTEFLEQLARTDDRVVHIKHGFSSSSDPAQGKCESRQRYLNVVNEVCPDFVLIVDSDEFYTYAAQEQLVYNMASIPRKSAFIFHRREIWRPPSIVERPLFEREVIGGFWDIPCCHWWRWSPGLRYTGNHNTPELPNGVPLTHAVKRFDRSRGMPEMIHLGFAAQKETRLAKNRYYQARGEGRTDRRGWYVESRSAWEAWQPGDELPHGARVLFYKGAVPEIFKESP